MMSGRAVSAGRGWRGLSIQAKLLTMLITTSVLTALVVGLVAYRSGSRLLEQSAYDHLTNVRESRAGEVTSYFESLQDSQVVFSRSRTAVDALIGFDEAYAELADSSLRPDEEALVDQRFRDGFAAEWSERAGYDVDPAPALPTDPAARYLVAHYGAPVSDEGTVDWGAALDLDDAGDGSRWSEVHVQYHDYFRAIATEFGYDDALLIDTEGNVVYTAFKGSDLAANLRTGYLAGSPLQEAYEQVIRSNSLDFVVLTDLVHYPEPFGPPTAWTLSPVGSDGEIVGVLALQIPRRVVNEIMTMGRIGNAWAWDRPAKPTSSAGRTSSCARRRGSCARIRRSSLRRLRRTERRRTRRT